LTPFVLVCYPSGVIWGYRLLTETSVDEVIGLVRRVMDRYGKMEEVLTEIHKFHQLCNITNGYL
jgi:hypothetical protein